MPRLPESSLSVASSITVVNGRRYPVIDGILMLRSGRDSLIEQSVDLIDSDRGDDALRLLLNDRDDYDRMPPATLGLIDQAIELVGQDRRSGARDGLYAAMQCLNYGPVADYFAVRPSTPTFISGLELIRRSLGDRECLVDLGCGIGQLSALAAAVATTAGRSLRIRGIDAVFSKLWLARHYFLPDAELICADIAVDSVPDADGPDPLVLCHDAFYFFADKRSVLQRAASMAGPDGNVAVGHVHHAATDTHRTEHTWSIDSYRQLAEEVLGEAVATSDDGLWRAALSRDIESPPLETSDAIALVREWDVARWFDPTVIDGRWVDNPLIIDGKPRWPSPAMATEYAAADYLSQPCDSETIAKARRHRLPAFMAIAAGPHRDATSGIAAPEIDTRAAATVVDRRSTPVRWGVVGCGWVARDYGIPAILATENHHLIGCVDPSAEARDRALREAESQLHSVAGGGARQPPRMIAEIDPEFLRGVDVVYVATPNHLHHDVVMRLAAEGKSILCEKPLAIVRGHSAEMLEVCQRNRVALTIAFDQRHHPAHRTIAAMIAEGRLGTITQIRIHYACWLPPGWSPDGRPHDNWRVDLRRSGGGAAIDLAPHGIDLCSFLTGQRIGDLSIWLQRSVQDYQTCDDGSMTTLRLADDRGGGEVLASIANSYACPNAVPRRQLHIVGTGGSIVADNTMGQTAGGTVRMHHADGQTETIEFDSQTGPFAMQIAAMGDVLRHTDFEEIWQVTRQQIDAHDRLLGGLEKEIARQSIEPH